MISEDERRQNAVAYWFNVVRPRIATDEAKPADTPEQARARLVEITGMSPEQFDAIPDLPERSTFEKLKG
jgi:hypothetical protein